MYLDFLSLTFILIFFGRQWLPNESPESLDDPNHPAFKEEVRVYRERLRRMRQVQPIANFVALAGVALCGVSYPFNPDLGGVMLALTMTAYGSMNLAPEMWPVFLMRRRYTT